VDECKPLAAGEASRAAIRANRPASAAAAARDTEASEAGAYTRSHFRST